jgi:hypothetical protein
MNSNPTPMSTFVQQISRRLTILWCVTPCYFVSYCLHLQGRRRSIHSGALASLPFITALSQIKYVKYLHIPLLALRSDFNIIPPSITKSPKLQNVCS